MKNELIQVHQILQQIFVRGIDAVHMGNALTAIGNMIESMPDEALQTKEAPKQPDPDGAEH